MCLLNLIHNSQPLLADFIMQKIVQFLPSSQDEWKSSEYFRFRNGKVAREQFNQMGEKESRQTIMSGVGFFLPSTTSRYSVYPRAKLISIRFPRRNEWDFASCNRSRKSKFARALICSVEFEAGNKPLETLLENFDQPWSKGDFLLRTSIRERAASFSTNRFSE